jgi:hypothetical protein
VTLSRSSSDLTIESNLRHDLARRARESVAVSVTLAAIAVALPLLGVGLPGTWPQHVAFSVVLPWVGQLLMLPNVIGKHPLPSWRLRFTAETITLERYGWSEGTIARPASFRRTRGRLLRQEVVLESASGELRMPANALDNRDWQKVAALLHAQGQIGPRDA